MDTLEHFDTDNMIDLTLPENEAVVSKMKDMGEVGQFVLLLLERAKSEGKLLTLSGLGTGKISLLYDNDGVKFCLRPSMDVGDEGISHAHYALRTYFYKKPWVRDIVSRIPDNGWVEIWPVTFAEICSGLVGEKFNLDVIERQYPNVKYPKIISIIESETKGLDQYFTYRPAPGLEFFRMVFRDETVKEAYLQDDQVALQPLKDILAQALPKIHQKLLEANGENH